MKTYKKLVIVATTLFCVVSSRADYSINFNTLNDPSAPTNPVFDIDGTTKLLGSAGYVGQLYTQIGAGSFAAIGASAAFFNAGGAGFLAPGTVTVTAPSVTANPTAGAYQLRVWNTANGSTYEAASVVVGAHVGVSSTVNVSFAGYANGNIPPVSFPQANGFSSFSLSTVSAVPEPATLALGLFGAAGLLIRRRK